MKVGQLFESVTESIERGGLDLLDLNVRVVGVGRDDSGRVFSIDEIVIDGEHGELLICVRDGETFRNAPSIRTGTLFAEDRDGHQFDETEYVQDQIDGAGNDPDPENLRTTA